MTICSRSRNRQLSVAIEMTNACNFRCRICPQAHRGGTAGTSAPYYRPVGYMSPEVWQRSVEESRRVAHSVTLSFFGEQLVHPRYRELVQDLEDRPFRVEQGSNGGLITRDVMQTWIDLRFDRVRISLDAGEGRVFDETRPGPMKDLDGLSVGDADRLSALEDKLRYWFGRPDHRPTRLVFVKSSFNRDQREKFIERWRPLLGPEDHLLLKRVITYGGKIADDQVRPHRCNVWQVGYFTIDWRGETSPCNLDTNMDLRLGNIMDSSIDELITGERALFLRKRTGCGSSLAPCRWCVDANNWDDNEVIAAA